MRDNHVENSHSDDTQNWLAQDFVDSVSQEVNEDDPWSVSQDVDFISDLDNHTLTTNSDGRASEMESPESVQIPLSLTDDDLSEFLDPDLIGADELISAESYEDLFLDIDEPEPFAVYDSELGESLYVPDAHDGDTSLQLITDKFISRIEDVTETEQTKIGSLLESLSRARLRRLLSWLREQDWTDNSVLLFLEFRLEHWEENQHWWDYTFWNSRIGHWWTYSSPYILSLDATYVLVQARLNCSPDEVVEESWLNDWNDLALWKRGGSSFAAFALFRASLGQGEEWWEEMRWYSSNSPADEHDSLVPYDTTNNGYSDAVLVSLDGKYRVREDETTPRRPDRTPLWFAVQDWYDPSEWHDGLGWALSWADGLNPYMFDESLDSMRGLL